MPSWKFIAHRRKTQKIFDTSDGRRDPAGCEEIAIEKAQADAKEPAVDGCTHVQLPDRIFDGLRISPVTQADLPQQRYLPPSVPLFKSLDLINNREGARIPSIQITLAEDDEESKRQETENQAVGDQSYVGKGKGKERASDQSPKAAQARYRPRPHFPCQSQTSKQTSPLQQSQGSHGYSENAQSFRPEPRPLKFNGHYPFEHYSGVPRISPYGAMPVQVKYKGPFMQQHATMSPHPSQYDRQPQSGPQGLMQLGYGSQQGYQAYSTTPPDSTSSSARGSHCGRQKAREGCSLSPPSSASSYQPDSSTQRRVQSIMGPPSMGTYQEQRRFEIAAQSASTLQRQVTFPDVNVSGKLMPARSHPKTQDHVGDPPVRHKAAYSIQSTVTMAGGATGEGRASSSNAGPTRLSSSGSPQHYQTSSSPLRYAIPPPFTSPNAAARHTPATRSPLHHQTNLQALDVESVEPGKNDMRPKRSIRLTEAKNKTPKLAEKFSLKELFGRALGGKNNEEEETAAQRKY